jgi:hypothetical protein
VKVRILDTSDDRTHYSFLFDSTLDATNWRAEQAIRPAVVTRTMAGGRTGCLYRLTDH